MGLFSFVGKAIKGIGKVVGTVAKVGVSAVGVAAKLGVPIPGGGLVSTLLAAKQKMSTAQKTATLMSYGPAVLRGNLNTPLSRPISAAAPPGPQVLRLSPVLPGGAIATPAGPKPPSSAAPPIRYSASSGRKKTTKRKATKTKKRKSSGRKLKFGSPAWRKKYAPKKKRRAA